jgi:hypothetical protein
LLHRHLGAGITEIRTIPRLGASLVIMRVSHGFPFFESWWRASALNGQCCPPIGPTLNSHVWCSY